MRSFIKTMVLVIAVGMIANGLLAQSEPPAVILALNELNRETNGNYTFDDIYYFYSEQFVNGENFDCPTLPNTADFEVTAYIIQFDTVGDGEYEWEYRVGTDSGRIVYCRFPGSESATTETPPDATPTTIEASPTPLATPVLSASTVCNTDLPSRLTANIGQVGRVVPGGPNNVRQDPNIVAPKVGEIEGGEAFDVLEGPFCGDGYAWWLVATDNLEGWTVEGSEGEYFIEPELPQVTVINVKDTLEVIAVLENDVTTTDVLFELGSGLATIQDSDVTLWEIDDLFTESLPFSYILVEEGLSRDDLLLPDVANIRLEGLNTNKPVAVSADASRVANINDENGTVELYDVASGTLLGEQTLTEGKRTIWDVAITPDGNTVISLVGEGDNYGVYLWDVPTDARAYQALDGALGVVSMEISADGRLLVIGSDTVPVRILGMVRN
jgi:hypothetical protein